MIVPLYAILIGENSYIESGWYRVTADTEKGAINKLTNEFMDKIPSWLMIDIKKYLNIIDVHKINDAVII